MFRTLQIIHALSAGFKAVTSSLAVSIIRKNVVENDPIGAINSSS
jgi:hypothetical protein